MHLDWLIIGGGIHGVHLAARLVGEARVSRNSIALLDPADSLLARWRSCTAATGMSHLRSPGVHHLDVLPLSLHRFAKTRSQPPSGQFAPPYDRPSLELFDAHCDSVVGRLRLDQLHIQDRAVRCRVGCDAVSVRTATGRDISARRVVLAIGTSEQPRWPPWAPRDDARVRHIFGSPQPRIGPQNGSVGVIGGGISAVQVALRLARQGREVHLISRHPIRRHQFDSDPSWLGPKSMARFERIRCHDRRRTIISRVRHRGSVPPALNQLLRRAIENGEVVRHETTVDRVETTPEAIRLLGSNGMDLRVDQVLLATGFAPERPGGAMVDDLIASASLPCASCGFPIVDPSLRWHPRIFVAGPLAELELGPVARNIAGARRAGDRLMRIAASIR